MLDMFLKRAQWGFLLCALIMTIVTGAWIAFAAGSVVMLALMKGIK